MLKKIILGILGILVIAILAFVIYVQNSWDKTYDVDYPDLHTSSDSAVIARGKYLVTGPAHCTTCHVSSYHELINVDKGEILPLKGGLYFPLGPLGTVYSKNLTPDTETGIGRYDEGQVFRMMRHAIRPNGVATVTPMMPFWNMADEDLEAVVSYLMSLEPVKNEVPEPDWTFMGKTIRSLSPVFKPVLNPTPPQKAPPMLPTIERGKYLANYVANCVGCHTPRDLQTFEPIGPDFSGGMEFEPIPEAYKEMGVDPDLWIRSQNITPDPSGVLSRFKNVDEWIARFRQGRLILPSPMPWTSFKRISDEDLEAIWLYLNSLDPVEHDVGEITYKK